MEALLQQSGIEYHTPGGEQFASLQHSYTGAHSDSPLSIITLPETSEQVATIVRQSLTTTSTIVVRGGGHDCFGRFAVKGAVSIDLRNLDFVSVAEDKKTARVGGGVKATKVLGELAKAGLQVPVGACGDVGFTSWCMIGGFGPYSSEYGIGSDQIVGARVVNAEGEVVDADERLLKGLRGGGGSLAIVTELVVKTYPLKEVQAGVLVYDNLDLPKTVATFFTNHRALQARHPEFPQQLCVAPFLQELGPIGMALACLIVWNGPRTPEGTEWIDRVAALAPLLPGTPDPHAAVSSTTAKTFVDYATSLIPPEVIGTTHAVSITEYTAEVVDVLAEHVAKIKNGLVGGFNIHTLRPESPSVSSDVPDSVVPYRKSQIIFEILGFGIDEASAAPSVAWATELRNLLIKTDAALPASYLPLTAPEFVELDKIYGEVKLTELQAIKREYDPKGVFRHTVPGLV